MCVALVKLATVQADQLHRHRIAKWLYTQSSLCVLETCNFSKFHNFATLQSEKFETQLYVPCLRAAEFDCGNDHAS